MRRERMKKKMEVEAEVAIIFNRSRLHRRAPLSFRLLSFFSSLLFSPFFLHSRGPPCSALYSSLNISSKQVVFRLNLGS